MSPARKLALDIQQDFIYITNRHTGGLGTTTFRCPSQPPSRMLERESSGAFIATIRYLPSRDQSMHRRAFRARVVVDRMTLRSAFRRHPGLGYVISRFGSGGLIAHKERCNARRATTRARLFRRTARQSERTARVHELHISVGIVIVSPLQNRQSRCPSGERPDQISDRAEL